MKETVEEAAERYAAECGDGYDDKAFIAGAKWQAKRMYSEEDMIEFSDWVKTNYHCVEIGLWIKEGNYFTTKELLQIWKEEQSKKVFYE